MLTSIHLIAGFHCSQNLNDQNMIMNIAYITAYLQRKMLHWLPAKIFTDWQFTNIGNDVNKREKFNIFFLEWHCNMTYFAFKEKNLQMSYPLASKIMIRVSQCLAWLIGLLLASITKFSNSNLVSYVIENCIINNQN